MGTRRCFRIVTDELKAITGAENGCAGLLKQNINCPLVTKRPNVENPYAN